MNQTWDGGDIAFQPLLWAKVLRVLKPGGHMVAFSGTRTYHRMACAIEDAGFEIRDQLAWVYGSGFPKSHNISKGIDKAAGAEREIVGFDEAKFRPNRDKHLLAGQAGGGGKLKADNGATITAPLTEAAKQWDGWGTALKPAWEPIVLARKPLSEGTVVANVLAHGTGGLNVDGCRVGTNDDTGRTRNTALGRMNDDAWQPKSMESESHALGRFPANLCLSYPEDQFALRRNVTEDQKRELYRWMSENA